MLTQESLVADQRRFLLAYSNEAEAVAGDKPVLYAVTLRPLESWIKTIPIQFDREVDGFNEELNRLTAVEALLQRLIFRIEKELLKKPHRPCNSLRRIRSRNCIESLGRFGEDSIHHSHGIWAIYPSLIDKFRKLLVPCSCDENSDELSDEAFFLNDCAMGPMKELIHSVEVKPCTDLDLWLDYSSKNIKSYAELNRWGTFDTPIH